MTAPLVSCPAGRQHRWRTKYKDVAAHISGCATIASAERLPIISVRKRFFEKADRIGAGDPRPSLEERYPAHAVYVAKVTTAANQLVKQRLLLQQDANTIISQANAAATP